MHLND